MYFVLLCYLIIDILFSEKNVFKYFNNLETIHSQKKKLNENLFEKDEVEKYLEKMKSNKELRKLTIKEKLFYKEKGEKVILYKIID